VRCSAAYNTKPHHAHKAVPQASPNQPALPLLTLGRAVSAQHRPLLNHCNSSDPCMLNDSPTAGSTAGSAHSAPAPSALQAGSSLLLNLAQCQQALHLHKKGQQGCWGHSCVLGANSWGRCSAAHALWHAGISPSQKKKPSCQCHRRQEPKRVSAVPMQAQLHQGGKPTRTDLPGAPARAFCEVNPWTRSNSCRGVPG
jgi:hypothetical protein